MKMAVKIFSLTSLLFVAYANFAQPPVTDSLSVQIDYSKLSNWAAHPWKNDPSDSVPEPLRNDYHADSSVDIFFIHPTTYTNWERPFGWNAPVDDTLLNKKTDE